jgi:hypothetical protein
MANYCLGDCDPLTPYNTTNGALIAFQCDPGRLWSCLPASRKFLRSGPVQAARANGGFRLQSEES